MDFKLYLRSDFDINLRGLLIKDYCEECGSNEELHLHHVDMFQDILLEAMEELKLEIKNDTAEYEEHELSLIKNIMLGKQIRTKYKTLCVKCHIEEHKKIEKRGKKKEEYINKHILEFKNKMDSILKEKIKEEVYYLGDDFKTMINEIIGDDEIILRVLKHNGKRVRSFSYGFNSYVRFFERVGSKYTLHKKVKRIKGNYKERRSHWFLQEK